MGCYGFFNSILIIPGLNIVVVSVFSVLCLFFLPALWYRFVPHCVHACIYAYKIVSIYCSLFFSIFIFYRSIDNNTSNNIFASYVSPIR